LNEAITTTEIPITTTDANDAVEVPTEIDLHPDIDCSIHPPKIVSFSFHSIPICDIICIDKKGFESLLSCTGFDLRRNQRALQSLYTTRRFRRE